MSRSTWLVIGVWWTAFGLLHFFSLLEFLPFEDVAARRSLAWTLSGFFSSLPLAWLVPRVKRPRGFAGLVVLATLLSLLWGIGGSILEEMADPFLSSYTSYLFLAPSQEARLDSPLAFPGILLGLLVVLLLLEQRTRLRGQQQSLVEVERTAQRAQLEALRYQLNPHFLFNALNSIGALATEDPEKTRQVVTQLADFLRYSLLPSNEEASRVTLQQEIEAIVAYLGIEQVRFESDLVVTYAISEAAGVQEVPAFLLLPLVDNAIKYGQRTSPTPLRIKLSASFEDGALWVEVANTGRWLEDASVPGTRKGLANVEQRLAAEYPGRYSLTTDADGEWVRVSLSLRPELPK
ncbi:MAG: histidine kinase [Polyangiaceae bacterium]|nr:histidine kinase [Myxococcales bacterium]MCB9588006.1 histidine kinase [Polyangiaceae bacterium]